MFSQVGLPKTGNSCDTLVIQTYIAKGPAMSISVRLKPELAKVLERECRRQRKTRTALIHEALIAFLQPPRPRLGDVFRDVLADMPEGLGIERGPQGVADRRDWV